MHDCRTTEGRLVDLMFDELGADERRRLLAELDACADCLDEYRSMAGALCALDEAGEAALPGESYWPTYHAALRRRLRSEEASVAAPRRAPFWRRALAARLTVPAPAAVAIALALLVSSVLALRPRATAAAPSPAPGAQTVTATQPLPTLPVPVVTERIVTRVVYVEKRRRERLDGRPSAPLAGRSEGALASGRDKESGQGGLFKRANLTDFQPSNELKIRVIKKEQFR